MHNICSIIVTFNRKELLSQNVEALLLQSCPTDILIVDNASTDGTRDYVEELIQTHGNILYCNTGKNIGGAGGFSHGLETAFNSEKTYDLFWLMDDDGHPVDSKCLENIVSAFDGSGCDNDIFNSIVECNHSNGMLSFGLSCFSTIAEVQKAATNNLLIGYINPFNGTLISRTIVQEIGYPNANFFIGYDEVEYITRAQVKAKSRLITVTNSLYYHPSRLPEEYISFFGKKIVYKSHPVWKDYYRMRNTVYTMKTYKSNKSAMKYAWKNIIRSLVFPSKDKINRIKYVYEGYRDGMRSDFSKNNKHIRSSQ